MSMNDCYKTLTKLAVSPGEVKVETIDGKRWMFDRYLLTCAPVVATVFQNMADGHYRLMASKAPVPLGYSLGVPSLKEAIDPLVSAEGWRPLRDEPEPFLYAPGGRHPALVLRTEDGSGHVALNPDCWSAWNTYLSPKESSSHLSAHLFRSGFTVRFDKVPLYSAGNYVVEGIAYVAAVRISALDDLAKAFARSFDNEAR